MSLPLVTCICPTANRRDFLRASINHYMAQDYPNKRLVVIEDGMQRNADLIFGVPNAAIRHLGPERLTIGEKRNIAIGAAEPGLIAHWDDDDWHSPTRLSKQVAALGKARLCGVDRLVFFDGDRAWLYCSLDPGWLAGGTLLYDRELAIERPFEARSSGEDTLFVRSAWAHDVPIVRMTDERLYVARIHPGNTDTKVPDSQWSAYDVRRVRRWLGVDMPQVQPHG